MREKWARRIVYLTGTLVLLLSAAFAALQNPGTGESTAKMSSVSTDALGAADPQRIAAGREVYQQHYCSGCHAIAGDGNPRNPLDHVGAKYSARQLRDRITGAESLRGILPDQVIGLKQRYQSLSEADLEALAAYLRSL